MQWEKVDASDIAQKFHSVDGEIQLLRSFMAMLSKSGLHCAIEDGAGRILYLNSAAAKDWKVKASECHGQTISEILDIASGYDSAKQNRRIIANERPVVFFVLAVDENGETTAHTILKFPVWDSDGDIIIGWIGLISRKPISDRPLNGERF